MKVQDRVGQIYGKLKCIEVIKQSPIQANCKFRFVCDCGVECEKWWSHIIQMTKSGIVSCGCSFASSRMERLRGNICNNDGAVITIDVGRNETCMIDASDYEAVFVASTFNGKQVTGRPCDISWRAQPSNRHMYAKGWIQNALIQMHRLVMSAPPGVQVDHKNGVTLDNRRHNLRLATRSQNLHNRPQQQASATGYRGVVYKPEKASPYHARVRVDGKVVYERYFKTAREAAIARDKQVSLHLGDFAVLNFPNG